MATGNIANVDSTSTLLNLLGAVKGSSSSQTTTPNISAAGMNQILQQILQAAPGIASQGKSAGLYNSTTQNLLNNDFATRAAGELAKQQAGSTTTTKAAPKVSTNNLLTLLGVGLGKNILGPTISGIGKKYGVNNVGDKLADSLGVGSNAQVSGNINANAPSPDSSALDLFSGAGDSLADFGSSLTVDTAGAGIDAAGAGFSAAADTGLVDAGEDAGGSFLSSLFGG